MMSNEAEKRCPLCAEEMDWTDQQFKPCKCGYQICIWCWHHIIDMAEKDETDGRCPACRAIYEKEKIVATQSNYRRTMNKNSNKKIKPSKSKLKTNEIKKGLTNVRVIQRKMAYVIGLPLSLADEDLLQRREYFGQYGKITKVSLSRTTGGTIQQFINDTCSLYITYSKEEEALRCIQSVHGFVLEGRFLRASFGTAKYCHAWLKNTPCNNAACLYLHSIGADEDSFGKDEVAAVHTRSRVQEMVGAPNTTLNRSGNVLPPPVDENIGDFSEKSSFRNQIYDEVRGSLNSTSDMTCSLPSKEREDVIPRKMTTFVDIVGRSNSLGKVPSSNNINDFFTNVPNHDSFENKSLSRVNQGSRETDGSSEKTSFPHPSYSENSTMMRKKTQSLNDISTVSRDTCHVKKFQNAAISDRIYRSFNSFSNEEIVEHLRRIDDENFTNEEEESALNAVENSIISNIMSIDFDSCEDSLTKPNGLSRLLDKNDGSKGSSSNAFSSDQSRYPYVNRNGFSSHMVGSRDNKEHTLCKPQYPVSRHRSLAPPGFSVPTRDPPPGFSSHERERVGGFNHAPSGNRFVNSSLSNTLASTRYSSNIDGAEFFDPAILSGGKGKPTTGVRNSGFEMSPTSTTQTNTLVDDARLWLLMHQSASTRNTPKVPQMFASHKSMQQESSYTDHMDTKLSPLDDAYGLSSRLLANQHKNYEQFSCAHMPQKKYANIQISNPNSYLHSLDEVQHKGEMCITEPERNERLEVNKYYPGYEELMFSSSDIHKKVFEL
ncbi:hypothetical protein ACJIZ3_005991 [Penstemon smallii]|uniref:CCR4-NOT transcription complex subunit 4 n=1 Tax=Penstemon smallii TaxID=265156 RepID=A0ABD3S6E9_9LAMI